MIPSTRTAKVLLIMLLTAIGVAVGFGMVWVVLGLSNLLLGPFKPEYDDTLRERGPVAIAYLVWVVCAIAFPSIGLLLMRRKRRASN